MRRNVFLPVYIIAALCFFSAQAGALNLDIELNAGGALAMGATDNPNATGEARPALGCALEFDLYLFTIGSLEVGFSAGMEYSYLTLHGVWDIPANAVFLGSPATTQKTDNSYSYLNFPIALAGRIPLGDNLRLTLRAGGFFGYFLGGSSDVTYSTEIPGVLENGTQTLDSDNTEEWDYGLHFYTGLDIFLGGGLWLTTSLRFDLGLADTTVNNALSSYTDTHWSLIAVIGLKYGF